MTELRGPECPYHFDHVDTEAPESPHTVAPPTLLPDSTPPTLVPILRRTARMVVRVPPTMSLGLSANLSLRKHYWGTFELVDEDVEEEDEEIKESLDSDRRDAVVPEGQQREAPIMETAVGKPLGLGHKAMRRREKALGEGWIPCVFKVGQSSGSVLELERPKRVSALKQSTLTTWIEPKDGIAYIDVPSYPPPATPAQTPPSPE
nr:hypothetical protein [Tanacetum cinerariifolium]